MRAFSSSDLLFSEPASQACMVGTEHLLAAHVVPELRRESHRADSRTAQRPLNAGQHALWPVLSSHSYLVC